MRLALLLCVLATSAAARTLMSPDEFDAWSKGKTLDYSVEGKVYGSESYFADRKVLDADVGKACVEGSWRADGDAVCFVYPLRDGVHCWHFWRDGGLVFASAVSADPEAPPHLLTVAQEPLRCPGPDIGA